MNGERILIYYWIELNDEYDDGWADGKEQEVACDPKRTANIFIFVNAKFIKEKIIINTIPSAGTEWQGSSSA